MVESMGGNLSRGDGPSVTPCNGRVTESPGQQSGRPRSGTGRLHSGESSRIRPAGIGLPAALSAATRGLMQRACTASGSGAYCSSPAIACASGVIIQFRKSRSSLAFAGSLLSVWTSSQVKDEIG